MACMQALLVGLPAGRRGCWRGAVCQGEDGGWAVGQHSLDG